MYTPDLISLSGILDAHARIKRHVVCTPLLHAPLADQELGFSLQIKAEPLQITGSFKYRGARNCIMRHGPQAVVAYSSGNHGQAVAAVAKMMGLRAVIVMPRDTPQVKLDNVDTWGAEIVLYDRLKEDRAAIAQGIVDKTGAFLVPPFEHPDIVMGQATCGVEIAAQTNTTPDAVVSPVGGGGLSSGVFYIMRHHFAKAALIGAEPRYYDDTKRSLQTGTPTAITPGKPSLCDALLTPRPGDLTFALNHAQIDDVLLISDKQALHAMAFLFRHYRIVAEPGGAAAMAAVLTNREKFRGQQVIAIVSGGNVDPEIFKKSIKLS
ncbi:MAG: threonine/serine dehydratase [Pseudomonadota bacterium]